MKNLVKLVGVILALAAGITLLVFAFLEGREEMQREREREMPVKVPARTVQEPDGSLTVVLDEATRFRAGLVVTSAGAASIPAEVRAYGRIIEDPDAVLVIRAPVSGMLAERDRDSWPRLGMSVPRGIHLGEVRPAATPTDRLDLSVRLARARAEAGSARQAVQTARSALERAELLNSEGKNLSDRAVQEARSRLAADEGTQAAARSSVALLEGPARDGGELAGWPLVTAAGGEVVDVTARPGEWVQGGQALLKLARTDQALAEIEIPPGEDLDPPPSRGSVRVSGSTSPGRPARLVGTAPADGLASGQRLRYRLEPGENAPRPGRTVVGLLEKPGPRVTGLAVPPSTVVWALGRSWVYEETAPGRYVRRPIELEHRTRNMWIVSGGPAPGSHLITAGAQVVLSEEFKSQIQVLAEEGH